MLVPVLLPVDFCFCPNMVTPAIPSTVIFANGNHDPTLECEAVEVVTALFLRGDSNLDGVVNVADAVATLTALFGPTIEPCALAGDANDDELFNIADAVYTLLTLFADGDPIPAPSTPCGADPTPSALSCIQQPSCP